jgi:hypothetical protein
VAVKGAVVDVALGPGEGRTLVVEEADARDDTAEGDDRLDGKALLDPDRRAGRRLRQVEVLHVPVEAAWERRVGGGVLRVDAREVVLGGPAPMAGAGEG